jgi:hypothetical protein
MYNLEPEKEKVRTGDCISILKNDTERYFEVLLFMKVTRRDLSEHEYEEDEDDDEREPSPTGYKQLKKSVVSICLVDRTQY